MDSTAEEIAARISLGWNAGNTMEAIGGETAWGNPEITRELIALVKASGFDAVRLPVSWNQYADATTAEIDPAWLARVRDVVQYCMDEDIPVIVNIHWDEGWLEENVTEAAADEVDARQKALWQQIATGLRDFDERLMFAGANEPNVETAAQMEVLARYHQTFVDAVRETGGRNAYRTLIVQGPSTDIEKTDNLWRQMPVDNAVDRLMAEVHFYTPYNFTLMPEDQSWGDMFYFWGDGFHSATNPGRNATYGEEADVDALFASMKARFVDLGIPVIMGEYAAMRRTTLTGDDLALHLASRAHFHEYVTRAALANGLIPFYWDAGGLDNHGSGIFDRRALTVHDRETLDALVAGAQ
ncbi:glycoside hydrolase family 5 protein [Aquisalinus flavus]|nr:glycoside hydrolase family 5 protein [Aquisalinus flavus]UNE49257.1 glycoside hydrolase family 5 protein [Aquisalinus flavus]